MEQTGYRVEEGTEEDVVKSLGVAVVPTRWRAKAHCSDKIESIPAIKGAPVRTITFAKPEQRTSFLRTYQKQIREESKLKILGFWLLLLLLAPFAKADDVPLPDMPIAKSPAFSTPAGVAYTPALTNQETNQTETKRLLISGAACGVGLGVSSNHARAAEIGLPVWLTANLASKKMYNTGHRKIAAVLQVLSPAGCFNFSGGSKALAASKTTTTTTTASSDPPSTGGSGGGNGSGGSTPPSSGGGTTPPNGGGTTPPTTPPVTPPVTPPIVPPVVPPTHGGPCIVHGGTDCGFGNGGSNNGKNGKPPVTPPGDPHTHGAA